MKKLFALLLVVCSLSAQAALNLSCHAVDDLDSSMDTHVLVAGDLLMYCQDKDNKGYTVELAGVGPGLELVLSEVAITCPTVSKKRLQKEGSISFGAIKVSASAFIGAKAGVALNHRGGSCFLAGINAGLGASVSIGEMTIHQGFVGGDSRIGDFLSGL